MAKARSLQWIILEDFADLTRYRLQQHQLDKYVEVKTAPLQALQLEGKSWQWYHTDFIESLPAIDILVVDGPPWMLQPLARYPALPLLYSKLAPNAIVVVDDFIRKDEQIMVKKWLAQYPEFSFEKYPTEKGTAVLRRSSK